MFYYKPLIKMKTKIKLMSRTFSFLFLSAFLFATMLLVSCSDDPTPANDGELITTLRITLTPLEGNNIVIEFIDEDGPGAGVGQFYQDGEVVEGITLPGNSLFTATIEFLNESEEPAEDITEEVQGEADDHQVFFLLGPAALQESLIITYGDIEDDYLENGSELPVGLVNAVATFTDATGTLTVVLVHEPNKNATGASDGIYNEQLVGGDEDIRVAFPVTIQNPQ